MDVVTVSSGGEESCPEEILYSEDSAIVSKETKMTYAQACAASTLNTDAVAS